MLLFFLFFLPVFLLSSLSLILGFLLLAAGLLSFLLLPVFLLAFLLLPVMWLILLQDGPQIQFVHQFLHGDHSGITQFPLLLLCLRTLFALIAISLLILVFLEEDLLQEIPRQALIDELQNQDADHQVNHSSDEFLQQLHDLFLPLEIFVLAEEQKV